VPSQLVCEYEKGHRKTLPRKRVEELVARMGYTPEDVTLALLFLGGLSPSKQEHRWSPEEARDLAGEARSSFRHSEKRNI